MKRSKFNEAQIAFFAAGGDGDTDRGSVPEGGVAEATFYNCARNIRADAVGDEAAETARGGERQAEATGRRSVAGQSHASGRAEAKCMVRPTLARFSMTTVGSA
jgi:hypothetical protein